jgi:hypothetical protein
MGEASAEESDSMDWTAVEFDEVVEMEWMVHFDEDVDMEFEVEMNDDVDMDFEVEMDEDVDMEYCVIETSMDCD